MLNEKIFLFHKVRNSIDARLSDDLPKYESKITETVNGSAVEIENVDKSILTFLKWQWRSNWVSSIWVWASLIYLACWLF